MSARQQLIEAIGVPVEQREIQVGDIKTAYLAAGDGPPLVLLHGSGIGGVVWYQSIGTLSTHFRVIAPDVVGYGESDKPPAAYDKAFYARWLRNFFDELGLHEGYLVGNSCGGAISLQFAMNNPGRIKRLALINSGALGKQMDNGAKLRFLLLNCYPSLTTARWATQFLVHEKSNICEALAKYAAEVLEKPGGRRPFWDGKGKVFDPFTNEQLNSVSHKTLILWGEEDQFIPAQYGRLTKKIMPNAQFKAIPRAGHFPFLDRPFVFNKHLIEFFKSADESY
ncbi:alpha/beta fold hydrolase [Fodinibius halophilus]|uniref:Alpha/beta hydrolase n=1 Tax=Fodinibius halophilus TaxID=1736908 RepID=A0A6M1T2E3_9BACT|nr:alpha/beta hydrolase [Fodinibius halophilus]NGP89646.1 alpha/beta hydrolase [Fodinibius halophilus]